MSVAVVYTLEVVDVGKNERNRSAISVDGVEYVRQPLVEGAAIGQSGERVRECSLAFSAQPPGGLQAWNRHRSQQGERGCLFGSNGIAVRGFHHDRTDGLMLMHQRHDRQ